MVLYKECMQEFKNQIKISEALAELFDFAEVYCSPACCGISAFEIHKGLLLRKIIDKGALGVPWYNQVKSEIDSHYAEVVASLAKSEEDIPIIYPRNDVFPEFFLQKNEVIHFFLRWQRVLKQVKGTSAIP